LLEPICSVLRQRNKYWYNRFLGWIIQ
jgi:hypothetical protein